MEFFPEQPRLSGKKEAVQLGMPLHGGQRFSCHGIQTLPLARKILRLPADLFPSAPQFGQAFPSRPCALTLVPARERLSLRSVQFALCLPQLSKFPAQCLKLRLLRRSLPPYSGEVCLCLRLFRLEQGQLPIARQLLIQCVDPDAELLQFLLRLGVRFGISLRCRKRLVLPDQALSERFEFRLRLPKRGGSPGRTLCRRLAALQGGGPPAPAVAGLCKGKRFLLLPFQ